LKHRTRSSPSDHEDVPIGQPQFEGESFASHELDFECENALEWEEGSESPNLAFE
jgi:hypothetical protein